MGSFCLVTLIAARYIHNTPPGVVGAPFFKKPIKVFRKRRGPKRGLGGGVGGGGGPRGLGAPPEGGGGSPPGPAPGLHRSRYLFRLFTPAIYLNEASVPSALTLCEGVSRFPSPSDPVITVTITNRRGRFASDITNRKARMSGHMPRTAANRERSALISPASGKEGNRKEGVIGSASLVT